jgi:hypothetical protein
MRSTEPARFTARATRAALDSAQAEVPEDEEDDDHCAVDRSLNGATERECHRVERCMSAWHENANIVSGNFSADAQSVLWTKVHVDVDE